MRRRAATLTIFLAVFAAGAGLAGLVATRGFALGTTTTETLTETSTTVATTTEPGQTVVTTATVEHTTTRQVIVPARTTTSASETSTGSTPAWVWVVLGVLAVAVVILLVALLTRRGGGVSADERARRLDAAVTSWVAQGYAVESKSAASAVVRRGGERIMISVDPAGNVSSQHLAANDWPTT